MKIDEKALAERLAAEIPVAEKVVPDGGRILVPISIDELRMCIACLEAAKPQPAAPEVVAWEWRWRDILDRAPWLPVKEGETQRIEFRRSRAALSGATHDH